VLGSADRGSAQQAAHSVGVSRPVWRWQQPKPAAGASRSVKYLESVHVGEERRLQLQLHLLSDRGDRLLLRLDQP
jgi:hypothetical protein